MSVRTHICFGSPGEGGRNGRRLCCASAAAETSLARLVPAPVLLWSGEFRTARKLRKLGKPRCHVRAQRVLPFSAGDSENRHRCGPAPCRLAEGIRASVAQQHPEFWPAQQRASRLRRLDVASFGHGCHFSGLRHPAQKRRRRIPVRKADFRVASHTATRYVFGASGRYIQAIPVI